MCACVCSVVNALPFGQYNRVYSIRANWCHFENYTGEQGHVIGSLSPSIGGGWGEATWLEGVRGD